MDFTSNFTAGATSVNFFCSSDGFADEGKVIEEWKVKLVLQSAADWAALFAVRTPRELISIRICPSAIGSPVTSVLDVGGGPGAGTLAIDGLDSHTALLTDLSSSAPIGASEFRESTAVFVITPT